MASEDAPEGALEDVSNFFPADEDAFFAVFFVVTVFFLVTFLAADASSFLAEETVTVDFFAVFFAAIVVGGCSRASMQDANTENIADSGDCQPIKSHV